MSTATDYDVVIIGGGPGGSTAGTLLSKAGKKVLLLEKEIFPRFRIGESLLPFGNEVFEELGVWTKLEQGGFTPKNGAEFVTGNSTRTNRIWFAKGLLTDYTQTFQVERSRFDDLLLKHSRESGCEVREGCIVQSVSFHPDGAQVAYKQGDAVRNIECRWVVDASGRDTFLGRHLKVPRKDPKLTRKIATYAHFHGVYRNPGEAAGHITIVRLKGGWFWIIPLDAKKTSVGLVQPVENLKKAGGCAEDVFLRTVSENAETAFRMKNAERVNEFRTTSDYTYRYTIAAGPRWLLAGDAGGFVDPIFSSGVMISMKTASLASRMILEADSRGRALFPGEIRKYTRRVFAMMDVYLDMIKNFYDDDGFEVFINPVQPRSGIPAAVNTVVAGYTRFNFGLWWRIKVFYMICRLQKWIALAPRLNYAPRRASGQVAAPTPEKTAA